MFLPKKGYKNFPEVAVIPEQKGYLDHEIVLPCIRENRPTGHDYQTKILTARSNLRIVLKRNILCFSIAKLTDHAISF